jgi:predicted RNA binding protein YcfA (HicA-like mRNA interferase family)
MPSKIRELKKMLRQAGFEERLGKGSHTNWTHPLYPGRVTISGNDGDDAKPYQEKAVNKAVKIVSGEADG